MTRTWTDIPEGAGTRSYQLLILVPRTLALRVAGLGKQGFPQGRYVYTGSARRGMEARIRRHLSTSKRLHWHIDYLLAAPGVRVTGVKRFWEEECPLNQRTPGERIIPGFGASDCRAGCGSHLKYLGPFSILEEKNGLRDSDSRNRRTRGAALGGNGT